MATVSPTYGSWTDIPSTNLESLGDNEWWGSGVLDNTSIDALDILIAGKLVGGANIDAGDTCTLYVAANVNSGDDDQWSGGIGTAFDPVNDDGDTLLTLDTEINDDNLFFLGQVTFSAASTTEQFGPFSILQAFGGMFLPPRIVVIVHNDSTTAAENLSTGNDIGYRAIKGDVT
jgi:hypothetical protein